MHMLFALSYRRRICCLNLRWPNVDSSRTSNHPVHSNFRKSLLRHWNTWPLDRSRIWWGQGSLSIRAWNHTHVRRTLRIDCMITPYNRNFILHRMWFERAIQCVNTITSRLHKVEYQIRHVQGFFIHVVCGCNFLDVFRGGSLKHENPYNILTIFLLTRIQVYGHEDESFITSLPLQLPYRCSIPSNQSRTRLRVVSNFYCDLLPIC